jgi:hypothetical protein
LSREVIDTLARRDLSDNTMYRCDRLDVVLSAADLAEPDDDALLARLEQAESHRHARLAHLPQWHIRDLHTNACGDFLLMGRDKWQMLRGFPLDGTLLSLDCDSLIMHAAAAMGVREVCLPADCRVFKGTHGRLFSNRITQIFTPRQAKLDGMLMRARWWRLLTLSRAYFDYPKRKVRGIKSVIGPSFEHNFVKPAEAWAQGAVPRLNQPENWGLGDQHLEERILCRASWDTTSGVAAA